MKFKITAQVSYNFVCVYIGIEVGCNCIFVNVIILIILTQKKITIPDILIEFVSARASVTHRSSCGTRTRARASVCPGSASTDTTRSNSIPFITIAFCCLHVTKHYGLMAIEKEKSKIYSFNL